MNQRRLSLVGRDTPAGEPRSAPGDMRDGREPVAEREHHRAAAPACWEGDEAHLANLVRALHADVTQRNPRGNAPHISEADVSTRHPRQAAGDSQAVDPETPRTGTAPADPCAHPSRPILVVDDDPAARTLLVSILVDAGHDVRSVASAREARHLLRSDRVALLLSEVSMPGETGLDLLQFTSSQHPETITLLTSARDDPSIVHAAVEFGACGYLRKPISRSAVLIAVQDALRGRHEQQCDDATHLDSERTIDLRALALFQSADRPQEATAHDRVMQAETIHRWALASESREPGIDGHLRRMSRCCGLLADKLGLDGETVALASMLHDIGKVAIPDRILLKREPLTFDERLAIQTHAEIGYDMLRDSASSTLDLAALIARTHHEKFDGSGYPHGLAGSDIPLAGRIAAVADVFDALTNDRAYRRAWSLQSTLAWMTRQRAKHFDPVVLDALTSSIDEIVALQGHGQPPDATPRNDPQLDIPAERHRPARKTPWPDR